MVGKSRKSGTSDPFRKVPWAGHVQSKAADLEGESRARDESGMVKIKRTTLGIGGTKRIPCSEISDVQIKIGMQQGQTATQSAKAYYDIKIHRKNGKKVSAGRNLRDKSEAEWLAAEMKAKIEAFR